LSATKVMPGVVTSARDGGPAFPIQAFTARIGSAQVVCAPSPGLSIRDYFAAHAPPMPQAWRQVRSDFRSEAEAHARWALEYADAMLVERAKAEGSR
jgi:hypothetical protein